MPRVSWDLPAWSLHVLSVSAGFSLASPATSHIPNTRPAYLYRWGEVWREWNSEMSLVCQCVMVCWSFLSDPAMTWRFVQDVLGSGAAEALQPWVEEEAGVDGGEESKLYTSGFYLFPFCLPFPVDHKHKDNIFTLQLDLQWNTLEKYTTLLIVIFEYQQQTCWVIVLAAPRASRNKPVLHNQIIACKGCTSWIILNNAFDLAALHGTPSFSLICHFITLRAFAETSKMPLWDAVDYIRLINQLH